MSDTFDPKQLHEWFGQLTDGTLSSDDHARLEAALSRNIDARRLWFQYADIETGLSDWAASEEQREKTTNSFSTIQPTTCKTGVNKRHWFSTLTWLIAASLVLAFGIVWWPRTVVDSKANGVAVLAHEANAVWGDAKDSRSVGAVLTPGLLQLTQGAVILDFYSGAQLIVEAPAKLKLVSAMEVNLLVGRVNAHVPPQASGFTIASHDFRLVDRGTDFGMVVADHQAEVHVFQGKVEIEQPSKPQPVRVLTAGQASQFRENTWKDISADPTAFVSEAEVTKREASIAQTQYATWTNASTSLSADQAAVSHYRCDQAALAQDELINSVLTSTASSTGRMVGCQWIHGRWPQKQAVQFSGDGARVRLRIERSFQEITLLAWVRVQDQRVGLQALLSADSQATGSLHWEVTATGQLRLAIARDLGGKQAAWEAVNSKPFITQDLVGQWLLLATTFDGKQIRHYGNGEFIGSGASFTPPALHIGTADLGNSPSKNVRYFHGAIDEFAILSRVLDADEIKQIYQTGKP